MSTSKIPSPISNQSASSIKNNNETQPIETNNKAEKRKTILAPHIIDVKHPCRTSSQLSQGTCFGNHFQIKIILREPNKSQICVRIFSDSILASIEPISTPKPRSVRTTSFAAVELNNDEFNSIESIDLSSLASSITMSFQSPFDGDGLDSNIGRIGEEMAYRYLLTKYHGQSSSVSIIWKNEHEESHLPYDISFIENGQTQYIEVKSTRTYHQHTFPISIHQIKTFLQEEENYFIYRKGGKAHSEPFEWLRMAANGYEWIRMAEIGSEWMGIAKKV